jgi:hypothetical protein
MGVHIHHPRGAVINVLSYFDHEIGSIICTVDRYGIYRSLAGSHGMSLCLVQQQPSVVSWAFHLPTAACLKHLLHSGSLIIYRGSPHWPTPIPRSSIQPTLPNLSHVYTEYEQRYSHFIQAGLIMIFVAPPLQWLFSLTLSPTSVLAGIFMFMAYQSLTVNPIPQRIAYLVTPIDDMPDLPSGASWSGVHAYTLSQIVLTGIVFGVVTLPVAAPAFPIIIIILVPVRLKVMNKIWTRKTLTGVDGGGLAVMANPEDDFWVSYTNSRVWPPIY